MAAPDLPIGTRPLLFQEQVALRPCQQPVKTVGPEADFTNNLLIPERVCFRTGNSGGFLQSFPDFPDCVSSRATIWLIGSELFPDCVSGLRVYGRRFVKCPEFFRIARGIPGLSPGRDMPYFVLAGGWNPYFERCLPILSLSRLRYLARYGLPVGIIATSACNFQTCCRYRGR